TSAHGTGRASPGAPGRPQGKAAVLHRKATSGYHTPEPRQRCSVAHIDLPEVRSHYASDPKFGFVHIAQRSGGERQGVGEAVEEGAGDFDDLVGRLCCRGNGDGPEGLADKGEGVREGRVGLGVPGGLTDGEGLAVEARVSEEG